MDPQNTSLNPNLQRKQIKNLSDQYSTLNFNIDIYFFSNHITPSNAVKSLRHEVERLY